jgi:hypothetical protein
LSNRKNILLAPNGKPSNLNEEQHYLVRTPEFKKWFGDWEKLATIKVQDPAIDEVTLANLSKDVSKVVDENGEPLVVYHTSSNEINVFRVDSKINTLSGKTINTKGAYFTANPKMYQYKGDNIIKCFLNIKNPTITTDQLFSGLINEDKYRMIIERGSDGVVLNLPFINEKNTEIVVFQPNQIKLADGSNTTFDGSNPDIRFEDGGEVKSNSFMKWYIDWYKGISDKMFIAISLPTIVTPFKEKNVVILDVFYKKDPSIDAKPYLKKIVEKADEYGVVIYLEPKDNIEQYQKFGFELTPNKQFMKRLPHFADGGLIAPNGKKSNLTTEQYKLVRTPEFKAWFGDWQNDPENASKVVDENGEPMVVYHGSNNIFTIFDKQRIGSNTKASSKVKVGFYFTTDIVNAKSYATENNNFLSCFLNIRNIGKWDFEGRGFNGGNMFDNFPSISEIVELQWDKITSVEKGYISIDEKWLYDGILAENIVDSALEEKPKPANTYVVWYQNQIKLADGSNTNFDGSNPDIRFDGGGNVKKEKEVKDLIVLHNINEYQIKEANKLGGLVTPSIAILKSGNAFTDFGSISLIATKELIDPKNYDVKVFAGDVYSPSVPRKLWYVDKRLLEKVTTQLIKKSYLYEQDISKSKGEVYHLVSNAIGDYSDLEKDISRLNFKDLIDQYNEKLRLVYIVEKGIKIKVPMKEKRHFLFSNVEFTLTDEQKKRFAPILREYTEESNEKGSSGISQENQSKVYDLFLEVLDGVKERIKSENSEEASEYLIDSITKSFEKYVGTRYDWGGHSEYNLSKAVWGEQELDKEKFNQNIRKIFTKTINEDYQKWISDFMSQFQGSAYFLKGNEKVPYTLDNLVDATSNKIVGQEKNMTFGVNQAKSYATKRLNSIEDIKKNSDKLISKEEMNVIDENNKEDFFKLAESLKYEYDSWGKFDSLGRALADYFKGSSVATALRKNDFKSPTNSQEYLFKEFADALKNSPVDYFEAKYQRAVSLKEFKYAIVPKTTSKEVIQILKDNGLIVKKYENNVERLEIINNIADKDKKIKFDDGGLLASNGNYSNLTPEQYKLVRTPEFKAWFGDWENDPANASKVVDENGEPLVVYHATFDDFNVFLKQEFNDNASLEWYNNNTIKRIPNGFYFTDNNEASLEFAIQKQGGKLNEQSYLEDVIVLQVFLNIKKPDPIYLEEQPYYLPNLLKEYPQIISKLNDGKTDGLISQYGYLYLKSSVKVVEGWEKGEYMPEEIYGREYIVLNSNQIKLADGTNTTFDGGNPDIRYAKGGYVPISQFNRSINNELKNYIDEDEEVSFEYKRERVKLVYALKFYEKNNITPLAEPDLESDSFLWQYVAYNDSDYRIMFHFNFEVGSIKLEKVIATLYSEDYNDEIKTFADGGKVKNDLDAYEEAMGESFFDEGGKAPIKKVYVSIRVPYDIQKVDGEYFYKYKEKAFLELMAGTLDGVIGVSSSANNVAEWFTTRDALIVMNYNDFVSMNNVKVIDYENIDELMANDLFIFRRLYNNLNEYDESEQGLKRTIKDSLSKIGRNISRELNLLMEVVNGQKAKEVYRIERFLNPSETSAFWRWIESNEVKIDSAISFTKAVIEFNKIDDNYLGQGFPNPILTIEDLLPSVENGIKYSSKIFESEQEIMLLDRKLNIPKNSQLFFKIIERNSDFNELIENYKLSNRYKIFFVNPTDLERFRTKFNEKQQKIYSDRNVNAMLSLEDKKNQVLQDLLKKFLDNTYAEIEKIIENEVEQYSGSKTFFNNDYDKEYQWYELPPIKKVLAEYEKIVRQEWEILESNKVKDLDLYKFSSFQDQAHQRLKEYFNENQQQLDDELYSYKTLGNNYISLSLLKYDLIKSLYDYENLPQWFSYKDLSKMYLQMMGVDIYRYYDKKDLKLVSQYEVGGQTN